jgi:hypothetical protein
MDLRGWVFRKSVCGLAAVVPAGPDAAEGGFALLALIRRPPHMTKAKATHMTMSTFFLLNFPALSGALSKPVALSGVAS